jgi:type IV fimbrial biogenesis protein FimT
MPSVKSRPFGRGFTLVELMVTIAVMVVVLAVATPSMNQLAANNQVAGAKSALRRPSRWRTTAGAANRHDPGRVRQRHDRAGWALRDADGRRERGRCAAAGSRRRPTGFTAAAACKFQPTGYVVGGATVDYTICRASGSVAVSR